jgi:hypothetical protein
MRRQGKKLLDVPDEKAAQMMSWAGNNPDDPKIQAAMKPYLDDMRELSLSTVRGTAPDRDGGMLEQARSDVRGSRIPLSSVIVPARRASDNTINTRPRAPLGPSDEIPGMEELSGKRDPYMAQKNPKGLIPGGEGNIPIWNRPSIKNADGSHSSELSISQQDGENGPEVLVPVIADGKFLTPNGKMPPVPPGLPPGEYPHPGDKNAPPAWKAMWAKAWKRYEETGEHLGKFDNPDNADAYANVLHNRGAPPQPRTIHVTPGNNNLIPRTVARQYVAKANGNPAVARIMAAHDGHRF